MTHATIAESIDLASRPQRLAAQFLDELLAGAPALAAFLVMYLFPRAGVAMLLAAALFGAVYTLLADGLEGGQSIGKRVLGLRVVSTATGAPCTFGQSFVRNLLLMILWPDRLDLHLRRAPPAARRQGGGDDRGGGLECEVRSAKCGHLMVRAALRTSQVSLPSAR